MNSLIRKFLSFAFWALILLFAVILPKLLSYVWWSVLVGTAPFLVRLAYEHFDEFNLFVNRIFLWTTNKEVAWEMKAHFVGEISEPHIDEIVHRLQRTKPSVEVIHQSDLERTLSVRDIGVVIKLFAADVQTENSEFRTELVLDVQRVFVPFHHSNTILNTLIGLIDDLRTQGNFESERYDFAVVFTDTNPYLGLFLRRLKVAPSSKLSIVYREKEGANQGYLTITKEKVCLVTHDLQSLQAFSKKYITLSSLHLSAT